MIDLQERLDGPAAMGPPTRPMRCVSGPQGPRVVLEGRPVLALCSDDCLGLAGHPHVREAVADAALRWGAGAGGSRLASGSMTPHRLLECELAGFHDTEASLVFGSAREAHCDAIGALARTGEVIFSDELNHPSLVDGCRLAGAEVFVYDHCDTDHLEWGLRQAGGRGALIVTEGLFALDGDVAPLAEIAELAGAFGVRLLVDEGHGVGGLGPGGRGAAAEAGIEGIVDVLVGSLGTALGSFGGYVCSDSTTTRHLAATAPALGSGTATSPPAAAGALAALGIILEQPRRVEKLRANAEALREALSREGFETVGSKDHVVSLVVGPMDLAARVVELALEAGVLAQSSGWEGAARLRVAAMAPHTKSELRDAARILGRAALRAGFRPTSGMPPAAAQSRPARVGRLTRAA